MGRQFATLRRQLPHLITIILYMDAQSANHFFSCIYHDIDVSGLRATEKCIRPPGVPRLSRIVLVVEPRSSHRALTSIERMREDSVNRKLSKGSEIVLSDEHFFWGTRWHGDYHSIFYDSDGRCR